MAELATEVGLLSSTARQKVITFEHVNDPRGEVLRGGLRKGRRCDAYLGFETEKRT